MNTAAVSEKGETCGDTVTDFGFGGGGGCGIIFGGSGGGGGIGIFIVSRPSP